VEIRPNIHGVDVYSDASPVLVLNFNANALVSTNPEPFLSGTWRFFNEEWPLTPRLQEAITLLNAALINPEPLAQVVLAVSAVEMMGQDEEWSPAQKHLLKQLADAARTSDLTTAPEGVEVAAVLESATTSRYDTTRAVPIPDAFLGLLDEVHGIRRTQQPGSDSHGLIWPQCNKTMYDKVGRVIAAAGIDGGPHATPRGIRYGFLVHAIRCRVILSRAERWMGFSQTSDRWHYVEQLERLAPEVVRDERTDASLMW
jgi:hypothetical protein